MSRKGRIRTGEIALGYRVWGNGKTIVLFVHGNLASKEWIELATPWLPTDMCVVGVDWRGCGDSDRPESGPDFVNYSMEVHAADMIGVLDVLGIGSCHLATHSTGNVIAAHMLLLQGDRFGKVLALDPVPPAGIEFDDAAVKAFSARQADLETTRMAMAMAAPSLFVDESLGPGRRPRFRDGLDGEPDLFEKVVHQAYHVAEGVWLGTPYHLSQIYRSRDLAQQATRITNEHLVIWGERDSIIPISGVESMQRTLPRCRLTVIPHIGHSMNIEAPQLFAGYMGAFLT